MTDNEFLEYCGVLDNRSYDIMKGKRPSYTTGSENALENFDTIARKMGIQPGIVAFIYFQKQADAIATYFKGIRNDPEPIESRFADAINYLRLMYAIARREDNSIEAPF